MTIYSSNSVFVYSMTVLVIYKVHLSSHSKFYGITTILPKSATFYSFIFTVLPAQANFPLLNLINKFLTQIDWDCMIDVNIKNDLLSQHSSNSVFV